MTGTRGTLQERLDRRVDRSGGPDACWPWMGSCDLGGYGRIGSDKGQTNLATHRVAWECHYRAWLLDLHVLHTCDNRRCCNPAHLWLGTHADNMQDKAQKNRANGGEKNVHARLTQEDVRAIRADPRGCRKLAKVFGVHCSHIMNIRNFKKWRPREVISRMTLHI